MSSTFSEGWYQVAELKVALLPSTKVHKQIYRGLVWYVLQDACSGNFFRVQEVTYRFISRLSVNKSVEQVWQEFIELYPEEAPGQEDIIQALSQLHHGNLLFYRSESDYGAILERKNKQKRQEHLSKLMAFMYLRIPLWNPSIFLDVFARMLNPLFSKFAFVIWAIVLVIGGNAVLSNWTDLRQQSQGFLAPDNLILLYLSMFVLKLIHEMGHAVAIKRFGGNVHTMGLMFIVLTPLPYVDATQTWSLRNRWQRSIVGAAGMYVELFIAALAALLWTNTAPGIINSLAFNMMIIGSVSSVLFNGNPLLKFDAYYILSDITDIPNLYQKSSAQWLYYFNRWILGTKKAEPPAENKYEAIWFTIYGICSYFYRLIVVLVIAMYAADLWIGLGLAITLMSLMMWVFIPFGKLIKYLSTSQEIRKNRSRAWFASFSLIIGILLGLSFIPVPYNIKAPGVIQSQERSQLFTQSGGELTKAERRSGIWVEKGDLLAQFENPDLLHQKQLIEEQLIEIRWLVRQTLNNSQTDLMALQKQEQALSEQLDEIIVQLTELSIMAPFDGIWMPSDLGYKIGTMFNQSDEVGTIYNVDKVSFVSVVSQEEASDLFNILISKGEIRLNGQTSFVLNVTDIKLNPFRKTQLPSASLGWESGGPIMASRDKNGEMKAVEPFFEVSISLSDVAKGDLHLYEGMTGWLMLDLPWRSSFWQIRQSISQILQQRYQI
jgi:putative peptide zinc metalloprotease protein